MIRFPPTRQGRNLVRTWDKGKLKVFRVAFLLLVIPTSRALENFTIFKADSSIAIGVIIIISLLRALLPFISEISCSLSDRHEFSVFFFFFLVTDSE